jgi:ribosomal 50S subunit-associated protein YjgA (DUF615 family)
VLFEILTETTKGLNTMGKSIEEIRKELINSGDIHLENLEKKLNDKDLSHLIVLVKKAIIYDLDLSDL